jgi:signal transduction histidine kinase
MLRPNLTGKILVAVGLTVAALIGIYTYFVFRVQSEWWRERAQAQNVITATMVHEYIAGVMLSDRHEEVLHFLQQLQDSREIWRGRVIDPRGNIIFSTTTQEMKQATLTVPAELFQSNRVIHGLRRESGQPLAIVMLPVPPHDSCRRCHDAKAPYLGAIVLERSLAPAEAAAAKNRNLLILYGALIFLIVGVVIWLLIVRLVAQPVNDVLGQMERVRAGDLRARAPAPTRDEIGRLAEGFNTMVQSLETTTRELQESHARQIQQADKLASIGELASGIAHEIRNPLAGIGAAVEVLSEKRGGNAQDQEIVQEIHRQINRLNTTLRELLDFSRPRDPEIVPCGIPEIVRPMLALVRPDAQKAGVRTVVELPDDLPPICADIQQMQQAVLNILLNAIQAMPHGGTLTVRGEVVDWPAAAGEPARPAVRLGISDTGVGIAPDNVAKIFSPFFTTKHRGTGLGLSITRSIIEKHGGRIRVASVPRQGTTFTLELAVCHEPAATDIRDGAKCCLVPPEKLHGETESPGH